MIKGADERMRGNDRLFARYHLGRLHLYLSIAFTVNNIGKGYTSIESPFPNDDHV